MNVKNLGLFTVISILIASSAVACATTQGQRYGVLASRDGSYIAGTTSPNEVSLMFTHESQKYIVTVPGGAWRLGGYEASPGNCGGSHRVMLGTGYQNAERDYMALIIEVGAAPGGSLWDKECRDNAWSLKSETSCLRTRHHDTLYTVSMPIATGYLNIVAYGPSRGMINIVRDISIITL